MTFTVTYRGADGALVTEAVEAANRSECFAQMKARGITPMGVKAGGSVSRREHRSRRDGGNGSRAERTILQSSNPPNPQSSLHAVWSRRAKAAAAVLVLASIVGGGAWWWMRRDGGIAPERPEVPKKVETKVPTKPATKVEASVAPAIDAPTNRPSVYPTNEHSIVLKRPVVAFSAQTNDEGRVVEHIRTDDGKIHTNIYSLKPPTFESGTDEQLAIAVSARPGEMPPPAPPVDPADGKVFLESLKKPILILDSDTPAIRELKERVIQARETMAQMMAQGHTFEEVLKENRQLQEENAITRQGVVENLKKILAEGDLELARDFVKESNAVLDQMGIMRVALPAEVGDGTPAPTKGDLMRKRRKENGQ
jgi:hypothetical protein